MPAPTNISFATAIDLGIITTTPTTVIQQVDDSGVTYTVYYKFTPSLNCVIGAWAFGNLTDWDPSILPFIGPVSSPNQLLVDGVNIAGDNVPIQFPATANTEYFLEIQKNFGNVSPAITTLTIQRFDNIEIPVGSLAVPDDSNGFPLAILSTTVNFVVKNFQQDFPAGDAADTLVGGTILVENNGADTVDIYDPNYHLVTSIALTGTPRIRTCLGGNNFYVGKDTNPVSVRTVSATGTIGSVETLTGITSQAACAAANNQTILYHAETLTGAVLRRWDLVNHVALSDLAVGIVGYQVMDILVLADDTIIVSFYKPTVTNDFIVNHYNGAGAILHTYASFGTLQLGAIPRLAYAIDSATSFWVFLHLGGAAIGTANFIQVKISDGSFLTNRVHMVFEFGRYQGVPTATPPAVFGSSNSCPFWITRIIFPIIVNASGLYLLTGTGNPTAGDNPSLTHDVLWNDPISGTTTNVKIPDPYVEGYLAGDE